MDLKCRNCGKKIGFITLRSGKNCPVNMALIDVDDSPDGTEIITKEGIKVVVDKSIPQPNLRGRQNHFQSCKGKR